MDEKNIGIQEDDFTGLDDGFAGTSEDAYQGDYTIEKVQVAGKTVNRRIGVFTPKTEQDKSEDGERPSLQQRIDDAERRCREYMSHKEAKQQNKQYERES